MGFTNAHIYIK